jgi:tetratricopeptide (TPR) repeat protein
MPKVAGMARSYVPAGTTSRERDFQRNNLTAIRHAGAAVYAGMLLLPLLLALSGCGLHSRQAVSWPADASGQVAIAGVPFFAQEQYQCGPAALAMALGWSGEAVAAEQLVPEIYSPALHGSLQPALIAGARRHGRIAYPITGMQELLIELAAGHPAVVLVNLSFAWYPKWHYAVAVGYDQPRSEIILHSGATAHERLSLRVFTNIWSRSDCWGLLVLPPGMLPATAGEDRWLAAAAGLEQAGQPSAAATAFAAATARWPESFGAWMGLGNSRYGEGDMPAAGEAYRRATDIDPQAGMAFNNLAYALWKMGKREEALAAARQAVALGGPLLENFRQTLEEIEGK